MQTLSVASEAFPILKTGGLADVIGALPAALLPHDVHVSTLLPGYPAVMQALQDVHTVFEEPDFFGGPARILSGKAGALNLFVADVPHLYDRPGNPYTQPDGTDWPDNPQRFAALSTVACLLGQGRAPGYAPDIIHAHDWQAGLAPAYLALSDRRRPATVFTIHNLAFQGQVPASLLGALRLPARAYTTQGVEYYGAIGMLKAGVAYADRITTVSPTYAAEICTPEGGMGMDGLLRDRAPVLSGILNGLDTEIWNPETDASLPATYGIATRGARAANKAALQAQFGLAPSRASLVFGVISRMTHQKGLDMLLACLPDLLAAGAQLALIGTGDHELQSAFAAAAAANPGRVGVTFDYDEPRAHLVQGGANAILVPSRFEPCGLTQLCALRYGAVPVVSRVGGLADTVIDANAAAIAAGVATGIQFSPVTQAGLQGAIARAAALWKRPRAWAMMQIRGMRTDVSWAEPGRAYAELYRSALEFRAGG